jgi:hypothetical protein
MKKIAYVVQIIAVLVSSAALADMMAGGEEVMDGLVITVVTLPTK